MNAALAYLLVVGALLAVAARAGEEVLRLARQPVRWAWAGALALMVALTIRAAVTGPAAGGLHTEVTFLTPAESPRVAGDPDRWAQGVAYVARARDLVAGAPETASAHLAQRIPPRLTSVFPLGWAMASLVVLVVIGIVYLQFSTRVRSLPTVMLHGTRVRVSPVAGPAVVGLVDPQIVVPKWLLHAREDEQRLAITHEREHLAARDPQLLIAACVAAAALPWHPAAWWMLARLRLAVEIDCDRRVLAAGTPRGLYGSALIDMAARESHLPFGAPALADHTTHLERRLIAMTPTAPRYPRTRLFALGAGMLLSVVAACEARLPSAPEIEALDAAAVESSPLMKTALGDTSIAWYVDSVRVTAEASRAIAPEDIASIIVNKGAKRVEINVMTKDAAAASAGAPPAAAEHAMSPRKVVVQALSPDSLRVRSAPFDEEPGLLFIDGQPADRQALARLAPDRIASVEVIKGAAARRLYADPRAATGVIRVTTKR